MRRIVLGMALVAMTSVATAECLPIFGTVELEPDPSCEVINAYDVDGDYPEFAGELPEFGNTLTCFSVSLKLGGVLPAKGYAGITTDYPIASGFLPGIPVPVAVPGETKHQGDFVRGLLAARSVFKLGRTVFYASEIITQSIDLGDPTASPIVTEQSVILGTNRKGLLRNATGYFNILGNSIGETARVTGEICTP